MNIRDDRATSLGLALVCITLLSGCGHMVQLADLHQVVDVKDVSPLRDASSRGVRNGVPRNDKVYIPGLPDVVELSSKNGAAITLMSAACSESSEMAEARRKDEELLPLDINLAQPGKHVRVSILALQHVRAVRVTETNKTVCIEGVPRKSWRSLQTALTGLGVSVALLPHETQWAMPGDVVKVTAEYRFGLRAGSAPEPYTFAATTIRIDSGGRGYVPAFDKVEPETKQAQPPAATGAATGANTAATAQVPAANPVAAAPNPGQPAQAPAMNPAALQPAATADEKAAIAGPDYSPLQVVAAQQSEAAARRISFWQPGNALDRQPTLDELERCLKAVTAVSQSKPLNKLFSRCASLGIDEYRYKFKDGNNRELSYRFSVEHNVTFVLWNGRRFVKPYRAGQTVAEAAKEVHREVLGHEVTISDDLFVVVDPHPAIRFSGEKPFYARLIDSPNAILDQVLVLPGDVVHLSRWKPRLPL